MRDWEAPCSSEDWDMGRKPMEATSGFTSVGFCREHQCHIWPIEEFLARTEIDLPDAEIERIKALNAGGKCEVRLPYGLPNNWRELVKTPEIKEAPKVRPITVVICTPCHGEVKTGMAWSLANAIAHFLMVPYEAELRCAWEIMKGSNLAQQRQQLVSRAMQLQATHILFWDSDIKAPADLIPRMLNHSKAVVCTNYPTKEMVSRPTVYLDGDDHTGPLWTKPGDVELVGDVARAGFGLILIDIETFYRIELPWFHFRPREPDFVHIGGEDHYFCDKVRAVGIPIFCDQALSNEVSHIGDFEYTNEWAIRAEETRQGVYNGEGEPEVAKAAE